MASEMKTRLVLGRAMSWQRCGLPTRPPGAGARGAWLRGARGRSLSRPAPRERLATAQRGTNRPLARPRRFRGTASNTAGCTCRPSGARAPHPTPSPTLAPLQVIHAARAVAPLLLPALRLGVRLRHLARSRRVAGGRVVRLHLLPRHRCTRRHLSRVPPACAPQRGPTLGPHPGPLPWAPTLGPCLGPLPWPPALGPCLAPPPWAPPWAPTLGPHPGPPPCAPTLGPTLGPCLGPDGRSASAGLGWPQPGRVEHRARTEVVPSLGQRPGAAAPGS